MREGRKPEYQEKTDDKLHKMTCTIVRKFKPQWTFKPVFQYWWQVLTCKADVLTLTSHVREFCLCVFVSS